MIRAAIVGGTGYGGMELLRLSLGHPQLDIVALTSRSEKGRVGDSHGHLRGLTDLEYTDAEPAELAKDVDLVFVATPHAAAARIVDSVLCADPTVVVIDLSGAHRLGTNALHAAHYGEDHPHLERLVEATYALPECGGRQALKSSPRLIANPGCHATAALLATWPLAREGLVAGRIAITSATGSTGSGSKPSPGTHHPNRASDFRPYNPLRHQHVPEVEACLAAAGLTAPKVDLVPQSAPIARGIVSTAFVPVPNGREQEAVDVVRASYEDAPLVRVLDAPPAVRAVAGSSLADVHVATDDGLACVMVAIDNLGKGMAGTAVQNANLRFGLPEATGLHFAGAGP